VVEHGLDPLHRGRCRHAAALGAEAAGAAGPAAIGGDAAGALGEAVATTFAHALRALCWPVVRLPSATSSTVGGEGSEYCLAPLGALVLARQLQRGTKLLRNLALFLAPLPSTINSGGAAIDLYCVNVRRGAAAAAAEALGVDARPALLAALPPLLAPPHDGASPVASLVVAAAVNFVRAALALLPPSAMGTQSAVPAAARAALAASVAASAVLRVDEEEEEEAFDGDVPWAAVEDGGGAGQVGRQLLAALQAW